MCVQNFNDFALRLRQTPRYALWLPTKLSYYGDCFCQVPMICIIMDELVNTFSVKPQ